MPDHCPVCGSKVLHLRRWLRVHRDRLPCQLKGGHSLCVQEAMDVEVGPALVEQLVDKKLINDPADIYTLSREDLAKLERMGAKSADNIVRAIEGSKERGLAHLLYALGIRHVGIKAAETLANEFGSLDALARAGFGELTGIPEIGPKIARSIEVFFQQEQTGRLIAKLKRAGVKMEQEREGENGELVLTGKVFVLTGTLPTLTRKEAEGLIKKHGGKISSSVSKKTDYVLAGSDPGQKYDKAKQLGIPIISEDELLQMV